MKFMEIFSIFLFVIFKLTSCVRFTFTNKHISSIKLKETYWKGERNKIDFKFVSNGNDGTLLSARNIYNEIFQMKIVQHKIEIWMGDRLLVIPGLDSFTVDEGKWYTVNLMEHNSGIEIHVDYLVTVLPMYKQRKWLIENWEDLIIGANDPADSETYEYGYEDSQPQSFVGCIEFDSVTSNDLVEHEKAILNGCVDACQLQSCENGGHCINKYEYAFCDCKGTGFEGYSCEIPAEALSMDGSSFIEVTDTLKVVDSDDQQVHIIRFRTQSNDGLLLMSKLMNDVIITEIIDGKIHVTGNFKNGVISMNFGINVNDNLWHRLIITIEKNIINVKLDDAVVAKAISEDEIKPVVVTIHSHQDEPMKLYYGGVPKELYTNQRNFIGCLQHLYFDNQDAVSKILLHSDHSRYIHHGQVQKCKGY